MRLALTMWDGRISPVFDVCRTALVLDVKNDRITSRRTHTFESEDAARKVDRLTELGVDTLVCGAISASLQGDLADRGIRVFGFVAGEIDEVIRAVLGGRLADPALRMPGYRKTGSPDADRA